MKTKGKYREIVRVSLPLVIGMTTTMVMTFTDRIFLASYSLDAIAAALPAGITAFLFLAFFADTAGYINVFIAQYSGAGRPQRVGSALWQGIYFSVIAWVIMAGLYFVAVPLFKMAGHSPEVQQLEVIYFRILCLGGGFHVLGMSLSCFFTGRGVTRPMMVIHFIGMILNIPLDYALINGVWIFPELGVAGAALATVFSWGLVMLLFGVMVFTRENEKTFNIMSRRRFESGLFKRLLRFGVPSSLQFSLDIFAFLFFVLMVGRIGKIELAVTNIAISLDAVSFRPLVGFALGTSTLVGQALGRNKPDEAVEIAKSTMHLVVSYISVIILLYIFLPEPLIDLFRPRDVSPEAYGTIRSTGVVVLRFVAAYLLLDGVYMISTAVLKGAGDTRFLMWSIGVASIFGMVLPVYIGIEVFGAGLYYAWSLAVFFLLTLAGLTAWRFYQGKWKTMRVIESE